MKKLSFLLIIILIFLTSCNTSAPSTYISSADDNRTYFYTVNFETNGGSYVPSSRIISGSVLTVPFQPKKDGTEFNGWYADKDLTIPYVFGEIVENDFTLYARWLEIYVVKFDTLGGSKIDDVKVLEGKNVPIPSNPTKNGYRFNGWYLDLEYKNPFSFASVINSNVTLYAYWI